VKYLAAMASTEIPANGVPTEYSPPAPAMSSQAPAGSNAAPSSQLPGHASFRRYDGTILNGSQMR
jgi:hypothetical protein